MPVKRPRVMQSFPPPRTTTNPYIVQLDRALAGRTDIEHLRFSWAVALATRIDVMHLHWPETLIGGDRSWKRWGKRMLLRLLLQKMRVAGTAIVRTVHNLDLPTDATTAETRLLRSIEERTDCRILLNEQTVPHWASETVVIPHGDYVDWFAGTPPREPEPDCLSFVGLVRRYKGVETLIDAFADTAASAPSLRLRISGNPTSTGIADEVRARAARDPRIELDLRFLSEDDFAVAIMRSGGVVLPYRFMHNSGSVLAALSLARPVLVPRNDVNEALDHEVGPRWVHMFDGELTGQDILAFHEAIRTRPDAPPALSGRSWSHAGSAHAGPRMTGEHADTPTVVIGIPTFRRPTRLARLLEALPPQRLAAEGECRVRTRVLVVDNDPAESARPVAARFGVEYTAMPQPGLAAVRNAVLDGAGTAEALAFVDDDEVPQNGWLTALVATWLAGDADFVSGRVVSTFDPEPDPWIIAGGFFHRREFAAGESMPFAATNNLLVDLRFVRTHQLRFDAEFGMTGGEDIRFTSSAVSRGARILACPTALVVDPVPPERAVRRWVLRRAYRVGATTVRDELAGADSTAARLKHRARRFVLGAGGICVGSLRWAWGTLAHALVPDARGARMVARGAGMMMGALGGNYDEYRTRHSAAGATPDPPAAPDSGRHLP